jgi:cbb3-type cytochrome oxidase maturation protein
MTIPAAALILILISLLGGGMAIMAFVWAVGRKQFKDFDTGAYTVFDEEEPVGKMTDNTFGFPESDKLTKENGQTNSNIRPGL